MAKPPEDRMGDPNERADDKDLELSLRPRRFADFVGQRVAKEQLEIFVEAAKRRGDTLDHVLDAAQAQPAHRFAVRGRRRNRAANLPDDQPLGRFLLLGHAAPSSPLDARRARTCSSLRRLSSACIVALTTLCGLVEPSDFVRMS